MSSDAIARFAEVGPVLALALFGFTLFWCFISFLLSRLSGWSTLADAYPAGEVMTPNVRYRWQSALMNANTKYNGALTIVADGRAVHFSMLPLFKVGHAPLSVPWEDIHAAPRELLFMHRIALTFARAPHVTMLIPVPLAERLTAASMGRFMVRS